MSDSPADGIVQFVVDAIGLKGLQRQGWLDRGVAGPESSADHSWSTALLAWMLAGGRPGLDRNRVLLLALVHDLPEATAGDTTPFDRFRSPTGEIASEHFSELPEYTDRASDAKHVREADALARMTATLPEDTAASLQLAWREYEQGRTAEARFVKQVDKLETAIQSLVYRESHPDIVIDSFLKGADRDISDPIVRAVFEALVNDSQP